jgi:hypothetical protein
LLSMLVIPAAWYLLHRRRAARVTVLAPVAVASGVH